MIEASGVKLELNTLFPCLVVQTFEFNCLRGTLMLFLFLISIFGNRNFVQSLLGTIDKPKFKFKVPRLWASITLENVVNGSASTP